MEKLKTVLKNLSLNDYTSPYKIAGVIIVVWAAIGLVGIAMSSAIWVALYASMGYAGYNLSVHGKEFQLGKMKSDMLKAVTNLKKIFLSA